MKREKNKKYLSIDFLWIGNFKTIRQYTIFFSQYSQEKNIIIKQKKHHYQEKISLGLLVAEKNVDTYTKSIKYIEKD